MKKWLLRTSIACVTGTVLAASAFAQDDPTTTSPKSATGRSSTSTSSGQSLMVSKIIGAKVKGQTGDSLGQVQDVIINPQSGRVEFAVLSGATSGGDKVVPVPWKVLTTASSGASGAMGQPTFTASIDKDKLQSAPSFDKSHAPDMSSSDWSQKIYSYFGVTPDTGVGGTGSGTGTGTGGTGGTGTGTGTEPKTSPTEPK